MLTQTRLAQGNEYDVCVPFGDAVDIGAGVLRQGLQPVFVAGDRQNQHLAGCHGHRPHAVKVMTVIFSGASGVLPVIVGYTVFA